MKLLVFFGNPGSEYNFTRHNLGFLLADFYLKTKGLSWEKSEKFHSVWLRQNDVFFIKPQTFYNNIGSAVLEWKNFYKLNPKTDLLCVCDDFNLPFGTSRLRQKGTAGGNNGLKSIINSLGTDEFPRLRLGTGNDELRKRLGDVDFVLSRFTPEEKDQLSPLLRELATSLEEATRE